MRLTLALFYKISKMNIKWNASVDLGQPEDTFVVAGDWAIYYYIADL